jgi:hypothetical protein
VVVTDVCASRYDVCELHHYGRHRSQAAGTVTYSLGNIGAPSGYGRQR